MMRFRAFPSTLSGLPLFAAIFLAIVFMSDKGRGEESNSLWPLPLVGAWEPDEHYCAADDSEKQTGTRLTLANPNGKDPPRARMDFFSYETEGGDCEVLTFSPEGLGLRAEAQCRYEEGEYKKASFLLELAITGNILSVQRSGDTSPERYYRCPTQADKPNRETAEIIHVLNQSISLGRDLKEACSNTKPSPDISFEKLMYNIISCEASLQYAYDFSAFIYDLSGKSTQRVCSNVQVSRQSRLDAFLEFLEKIGDLKNHSSASLLYAFATKHYKC